MLQSVWEGSWRSMKKFTQPVETCWIHNFQQFNLIGVLDGIPLLNCQCMDLSVFFRDRQMRLICEEYQCDGDFQPSAPTESSWSTPLQPFQFVIHSQSYIIVVFSVSDFQRSITKTCSSNSFDGEMSKEDINKFQWSILLGVQVSIILPSNGFQIHTVRLVCFQYYFLFENVFISSDRSSSPYNALW